MSELIDKLDAYGANTKEAMARMLDDEGFYLECLNTFSDLVEPLRRGDITDGDVLVKKVSEEFERFKGILN